MLHNVNADVADPSVRFFHVEQLIARGLIEFGIADPGSMNFTQSRTTLKDEPAGTYLNPEKHTRYALALAARHGLHPDLAIYEPGFLRAGAALARAIGTKTPIYRLMFCETMAAGFPPRPYGLAAYLALLDEEAPGAPWMLAGVSADVRPLIGETVRRGGQLHPRWPGRCAARHARDQSRNGRGSDQDGARSRRGAGDAGGDATGAGGV